MAGCKQIFKEKQSDREGVSRPQLDRAIATLGLDPTAYRSDVEYRDAHFPRPCVNAQAPLAIAPHLPENWGTQKSQTFSPFVATATCMKHASFSGGAGAAACVTVDGRLQPKVLAQCLAFVFGAE